MRVGGRRWFGEQEETAVVRLRPFPEIFVFSGGLNEEGWSQAAFERVFLVPLVPL